MEFKSWLSDDKQSFLEDALAGLVAMHVTAYTEARKEPEKLRNATVDQNKKFKEPQRGLFDDDDAHAANVEKAKEIHKIQSGKRPEWNGCEITPISSYDKEIRALQIYAQESADHFAQVLLFSPLSANVNFGKHWDNFPVVMTVLVTEFPDKIKPKKATDKGKTAVEILQDRLAWFDQTKYGLGATVAGWKYNTIAHVWNNRHELKSKLDGIHKSGGSDADLILAMQGIPGVAPVKAGFIAQLIYGKAGCIDTHNIDIYSRAFPELKDELKDTLWQKKTGGEDNPIEIPANKDSVNRYAGTLDKLKKKGIGTRELWDVWVDFVGHMYKAILDGGRGLYAEIGPALNPKDPKYADLITTVPKERMLATGKKKQGNRVGVDTITGSDAGGGASLTHDLPAHHPYEMLKQLHKANRGDKDALPFATAVTRAPKMMGPRPAGLHYFEPAIDQDSGDVDQDRLKDLLKGYGDMGVDKMKRKMARKENIKKRADSQGSLFDLSGE